MALLIGSASLFAACITLILCGGIIRRESVKKQQLRLIQGESRYIDQELEQSFWDRLIRPTLHKLLNRTSRRTSGRQQASSKQKVNYQRMENELRLAGMRVSPGEFLIFRVLAALGVLLLGFVAVMLTHVTAEIQLLILLFALTLAVALPRFLLRGRIKSRQLAIQNQMPNIMDVLSVSIEAGLGFDAALLKVIERFKGPLIDELAQVYREVQMGRPRREALAELGQRSNVTELQTFASAVVQSEQFGTPMKNVLRSQAQQLRIGRRQQAQEKGMKAPIKMMLPMVLFIFPVIFIILLGPTLINVIGQFS